MTLKSDAKFEDVFLQILHHFSVSLMVWKMT